MLARTSSAYRRPQYPPALTASLCSPSVVFCGPLLLVEVLASSAVCPMLCNQCSGGLWPGGWVARAKDGIVWHRVGGQWHDPVRQATLIPRLSRRKRAVRTQKWLYLPEPCWRLCDQPWRLFLGPNPCLCNKPRLPGSAWPQMHTGFAAVRKRHAGYLRMQRALAARALGARLSAPVPDLVAEFFV